jgi:hypothetical protein
MNLGDQVIDHEKWNQAFTVIKRAVYFFGYCLSSCVRRGGGVFQAIYGGDDVCSASSTRGLCERFSLVRS